MVVGIKAIIINVVNVGGEKRYECGDSIKVE